MSSLASSDNDLQVDLMQAKWVGRALSRASGLGLRTRSTLALGFGIVLSLLEAFGFQEDQALYRMGFWTAMLTVWVVLTATIEIGLRQIGGGPTRLATRLVLRTGFASLLIVLFVQQTSAGVGWDEPTRIGERLFNVVLVAATFELICACTAIIRAEIESEDDARWPRDSQLVSVETDPTRTAPLLTERLPFALQGPVLCLQMEDHYVRVHTSKGSTLLPMRFSDALRQVEADAGLRVHRSWWIAMDALEGLERTSRTARARLINGIVAPVSRPYLQDLNDAALRRNLMLKSGTSPNPVTRPSSVPMLAALRTAA